MKLLIASAGEGGLDDMVSPVFGRCPSYTIVEVENSQIKNVRVIPNQYASAAGGAGIQAAQLAANEGVTAVIASHFGPNATMILQPWYGLWPRYGLRSWYGLWSRLWRLGTSLLPTCWTST